MRLSKREWISEGIKALQTKGPAGLRIEYLCGKLGVTKGSFYYHFVNLKDFKRQLLEQWEQDNTSTIIQRSQGASDPVQQILALRSLTSQIAYDPEVAIRIWAKHDDLARRYQQRVDRVRCRTLESLYGSCLPEKEAKLLARLVCCLFVGAQQLTPIVSKTELNQMYDFVVRAIKERNSDGS